MKPKFKISLFGYGVLGVVVLVLMMFEIKDGNAPGIGLDAALLAFIVYMIYKSVNAAGKDPTGKKK